MAEAIVKKAAALDNEVTEIGRLKFHHGLWANEPTSLVYTRQCSGRPAVSLPGAPDRFVHDAEGIEAMVSAMTTCGYEVHFVGRNGETARFNNKHAAAKMMLAIQKSLPCAVKASR